MPEGAGVFNKQAGGQVSRAFAENKRTKGKSANDKAQGWALD